jgi:heat-inducible transcriptional repressor
MNEPILQNRDREVLRAIVDSFIQSGEPVGSRTISREHPEALSPATIRNVMADLEEAGMLAQPHPSAGRVPTDRGLRFYVEELLPARAVSAEERERIDRTLRSRSGEIGPLIEQASVLLAELSHNVGMALVPDLSERTIETIAFVRVGYRRVTALLVSRPGMVHHRVLDGDEDYSQDDLDRMTRYIGESFRGLTLRQIRAKLLDMMSQEKIQYDMLMRRRSS